MSLSVPPIHGMSIRDLVLFFLIILDGLNQTNAGNKEYQPKNSVDDNFFYSVCATWQIYK